MRCFNCGEALSNGDFCANCHADVTIYRKIMLLSNTYYNTGLLKAKNRDLSGAVDILRRSIRLNKNNIDARNLLGLVYFEMGETVQAFSEWVISTNLNPDNNTAARYLKIIKGNQTKLDNLNQSIKKFNTALDYAKNGTEYMAILQLNKVLNMNPNLVKAYELLTLMYMKKGLYVKARKCIGLALKIDTCNPLCLKYKKEIENYLEEQKKLDPSGYNRKKRLQENSKIPGDGYISGDDTIIPRGNYKDVASGAIGILQVLVGILIGGAAVYLIVTPIRIKNETRDVNEVVLEYNQKLAIKNSTVSELEGRIEELEKQVKQAEEDASEDAKVSKNNKNLLKAVQAFLSEDYEKSMEYIEKINTKISMNSDVFDSVYKTLKENMSEFIAKSYYTKGLESYDNGNNTECIEYLEKCIDADENYADAYYKLGWVYNELGNTTKSIEMFKYIVDNFPDYEKYSTAKGQVPDDMLDNGDSDSGDNDEDNDDYDDNGVG